MNFLVWNVHGQQLASAVASLVEDNDTDVVVLVESSILPASLLEHLNQGEFQFEYAPSLVPAHRISIYTRFPSAMSSPVHEDDRITIRKIRLPAKNEFLLVAVHMRSKQHMTAEDQDEEIRQLACVTCEVEDRAGHSRTILVGDLSMNPFEPVMVKPFGMNSTMSRKIAARRERVIGGRRSNPFFYNPMWSLLGDNPEPPGTYYYLGKHVSYYWNVFDQVLIRPDLVEEFQPESLRIIDRVKRQPLVSGSGIPKHTTLSDHLPISFSIDL